MVIRPQIQNIIFIKLHAPDKSAVKSNLL